MVALIACVLGVVSHFYPIPFPDNKLLLIGCVIGYVICASTYYLIERRFEGDSFFISKEHSINSLKDFSRVAFNSELDTQQKQAAKYTLKI